MNPLISINLCCYNSEKYLRETLQSIATQTYSNWELVVINDGSVDTTESIICYFKKNGYPVTYHYQTNKGLSFSRNQALSMSRGDYVAFIDHDDLWLPDKLKNQVQIIQEETEDVGLIYTRSSYFRENGEEREAAPQYIGHNMPEGNILKDLLLGEGFITLSSAVARKDICLSLGGFPIKYRYAEEYYLFSAIAAKYRVRCVQSICCKYRIHGANTTLQLKTKGYQEKLDVFLQWSPFLNQRVTADQKKRKLKELQTLLGAMMIKYDKQYMAGFWQVFSKGSFFILLREIWRYWRS